MADTRGFPHSKDDFADDERISFDTVANKFILENQDGTEWEYVEETGRWIPVVSSAGYISMSLDKMLIDMRV